MRSRPAALQPAILRYLSLTWHHIQKLVWLHPQMDLMAAVLKCLLHIRFQ